MLLKLIVAAILHSVAPGDDVVLVPNAMKADLGVPTKAVCRMAVDDTSWVACAWMSKGKIRIMVESS